MKTGSEKKIGQGMLILAMLIAMALMTYFFGKLEKNQRNPNQAPQSVSDTHFVDVILEQNRSGHYVTTGTINGIEVEFLLDTGATDVVVPAQLADELALVRGYKGRALTANGSVTVYSTTISQLSIGQISLQNVRASINPSMHTHGILLGMSALRELEFIQRGKFLTIRQHY